MLTNVYSLLVYNEKESESVYTSATHFNILLFVSECRRELDNSSAELEARAFV
jgi:hypothetical protein